MGWHFCIVLCIEGKDEQFARALLLTLPLPCKFCLQWGLVEYKTKLRLVEYEANLQFTTVPTQHPVSTADTRKY